MYKYLILLWMSITSLALNAQEETKTRDHKVSMEEMQKNN